MSNVNTRWNLREMFATDDEWREVLSKTMTMVERVCRRAAERVDVRKRHPGTGEP